MRVLFLNPGAQLGGAERSLLDVIESLLATPDPPALGLICLEEGPLVEKARCAGVTVEVVEMPPAWRELGDSDFSEHPFSSFFRFCFAAARGSLRGLRLVHLLRRCILGFHPCVVHSNGFKTHVLSALATPSEVPIVWHIRDILSRRPAARAILFILQRRIALALANSDFVAGDAAKLLRFRPIETVLNAIDVDWFRPNGAPPSNLDVLAMAPPVRDSLRVGLVATYAPWKGHKIFLEAAVVAKKLTSKALRFYLIGGPIYSTKTTQLNRAQLTVMIEDFGLEQSVGLVPFQVDLRPVYAALDIVVHASTAPEPFGRTIVEAMAMECAVIATNCGAIPEILRSEVDGLIVPPSDPALLGAAIARLADDDDLRCSLGRAARNTVLLHFNRDRLGPVLRTLYDGLARVDHEAREHMSRH